jgi:hypothetical protein
MRWLIRDVPWLIPVVVIGGLIGLGMMIGRGNHRLR